MRYHKGQDPTDLYHEDFNRGNYAILRGYEPQHEIVVLTVCSWAKPYSQSWIHTEIRRQLNYVHVSNAGVVPHEFERVYPFTAYDWNNAYMEPAMAKPLRKMIDERFKAFWSSFGTHWNYVVPYFRSNSNTWKVLEKWEPLPREVDDYPYHRAEWHPVLVDPPTEYYDSRTISEEHLHGYIDPDSVLASWDDTKRLTNTISELIGEAKGDEEE